MTENSIPTLTRFHVILSTIVFSEKIETRNLVWAFDAESVNTAEFQSIYGWKFERVEAYVEPKRRVRA